MIEEREYEVYPDQFTPWIPNHFIDKDHIPVDVLGGAILGHMKQLDGNGLTSTCNLLYSAVTTNFYLSWFSENSIKEEGQ